MEKILSVKLVNVNFEGYVNFDYFIKDIKNICVFIYI